MIHTKLTEMFVATSYISPTADQPRVRHPRFLAPDRFLRRYIEGWAEANAAKIASAVSADYGFRDPLVGSFDRHSLQHYFAILRRRVGLDSSRAQQSKVCLDPFPTPQWPARQLRFWRTMPECGLAGTSDIEIRGARVHREVVCYELNIATELLTRIPYITGRVGRDAGALRQ